MKNTKFKLNQIFALIILLAFGQGFAANCADSTVWGEFTTRKANLVDGYYQIGSPEELAWFACVTTRESGTYGSAKMKLIQDINLEGKLFVPISEGPKGDPKFKGTIDGQGHAIRGLYIKGSEIIKPEYGGASGYAQNVGFVSVLGTGGVIENLVLEVSDIYASSSAGGTGSQGSSANPVSVGTLVGWMEGGTIRNCVVEGSITASGSKNRVGGLVGNVKSATITDCVSKVSITASGRETHVGGIVGALRNGGTVNVSSCVFDGDTLISVGGTVGAVFGSHESSTVKASNLYYTGVYGGTGMPKDGVVIPTNQTSDEDLNSEEVVCKLNRGSWIDSSQSCSGDTSNVWSEGLSSISMNGSDGYKVSFDANGGAFASGAKTFKIVAKNALITADEITIPILANKKFAGWATTPNAEDPAKQLGEADSNKTLYAVWYDYYTVTFEIDSKTHETRSVVVPKHGHVSVEGFSVPTVFYDKISDTVSVKYYFTGWGLEAKWLGVYVDPSTGDTVKIDPTPSDTLHLADIDVIQDTALYPVWTQAETYSVTFDATLHGKTYVRFVKKVSEGDTVARPNDVVTNPGYSIEKWCIDADCTEGSVYEFSSKLESNLTLYAKWEVEKYAITYVMNGGTNNVANPDSFTVESDPITFAEPTYPGNTFGGWFYDAGFTSPATGIATGSTTGNKTLYAKWTPIVYTIEYLSGNEVSATIVADKKPWGANWTLKGMEYAFQREGYVHNGWSLTKDGPIAYAFGATYSEDKDLILYPHWAINTYTITYVANGNNIDETPNTYTVEDSVVFPASLSIDGYDFLGWEDENGNLIEGLSAGGSVGNRTITARLSAIEYDINYVLNDGVFEVDYPETYTIAGEPSLPTPVKSGFKFLGWKNENDEIVESIPANSTGDITLTAQWAEYPILVATYGGVSIYENENGTTSALIDDEAMTPISIPEDVTVDQVSFNRIFNVGKASTIVLPFSIDTANVHGGVFYTVSLKKKDNGHWQAGGDTVRTAQLTANTPYIVIVKSEDGMLTFDGPVTFNTSVENNSITDNGDGSSWSFKGTYVYHKWNAAEAADGNIYGFAARNVSGAKAGEFVQFEAGAWLRPMRAYLEYTPSTEASPADPEFNPRPVMMSIDDFVLPESIDFILGEDAAEVFTTTLTKRNSNVGNAKASDRWFDMSGRLLNAKPTVKGIYYYNGKRVLVK